jgi:hypothetical protein
MSASPKCLLLVKVITASICVDRIARQMGGNTRKYCWWGSVTSQGTLEGVDIWDLFLWSWYSNRAIAPINTVFGNFSHLQHYGYVCDHAVPQFSVQEQGKQLEVNSCAGTYWHSSVIPGTHLSFLGIAYFMHYHQKPACGRILTYLHLWFM